MGDPAGVSGMRGWWRASQISSPPSDGGNLTTWTDVSGNGAHAPTFSLEPIYRSSGAFLPNAKPVIEFVAANTDICEATLSQSGACTRFMLVRFKTMINQTMSSSGLEFRVTSAGQLCVSDEGVSDLVFGSATLVINTWYLLTLSDNGSNSTITYINGTQDGTGSTAHTNDGTTLTFASRNTALAANMDGYIADMIDYNSQLSAFNRGVVHSYFQDEYGITVSDYVASLEPGPITSLVRSNRRLR